MSRPDLNGKTSPEAFRVCYWLKRELVAFCRQYGLPTSGSKAVLSRRIEVFLETGKVERVREAPRPKSEMPEQFTRDTVIGPGWRCSQSLRAFFEREIGPRFHFDGVMRGFIKRDGVGKTLQDAIDAWHEQRRNPRVEKEIAPQFEYNRHIREFFKENEGATLQEAIAAWEEEKATRVPEEAIGDGGKHI
jgi:hypothetical protein